MEEQELKIAQGFADLKCFLFYFLRSEYEQKIIAEEQWLYDIPAYFKPLSFRCFFSLCVYRENIVMNVYVPVLYVFWCSGSDLPNSSSCSSSPKSFLYSWLTFCCCGWSHIAALKICTPVEQFMTNSFFLFISGW